MNFEADVEASLQRLLAVCLTLADKPGVHGTAVPYLEISRKETPSQSRAGVLDPSFCLVLQGRKVIHWMGTSIECGPGRFLTSTFELPAVVTVEDAHPERPYIGLVIRLEMKEISQVIADTGIRPLRPETPQAETFIGVPFQGFLSILERIVSLGPSAQDQYWAQLLKKNLIYTLLTSSFGYLFVPKKRPDAISKIPFLTDWIREHFRESWPLRHLAEDHSMSVSSLHHKFKEATGLSPIQFQRFLRLNEARRLLVAGSHDVTQAALEVGYASLSHFSRDYSRFFGSSPGKDARSLRMSGAPIFTSKQAESDLITNLERVNKAHGKTLERLAKL